MPARSRQKLKNWQMIVARPAPAIPRPATNIRSGASPKFSAAPETNATMAYADSPSKRSCWFSVSAAHIHGAPIRIRPMYVRAYGRIVGVDPASTHSGAKNTCPSTAIATPHPKDAVMPTDAMVSAMRWFRIPR